MFGMGRRATVAVISAGSLVGFPTVALGANQLHEIIHGDGTPRAAAEVVDGSVLDPTITTPSTVAAGPRTSEVIPSTTTIPEGVAITAVNAVITAQNVVINTPNGQLTLNGTPAAGSAPGTTIVPDSSTIRPEEMFPTEKIGVVPGDTLWGMSRGYLKTNTSVETGMTPAQAAHYDGALTCVELSNRHWTWDDARHLLKPGTAVEFTTNDVIVGVTLARNHPQPFGNDDCSNFENIRPYIHN